MMIGYARVSTDDQDLALQLDALHGAGCEVIFEDTASGADRERKGFDAAIARCGAGDVLVGWKIDRLGRTLLDLVGLVEKLKDKGCGLKILTGAGRQSTRPSRKESFFCDAGCFCRVRAGTEPGKVKGGDGGGEAPGRHVGRPRKLTGHKLDHARQLIADSKENRAGAAALLGVHVKTLRRALRER
jgi:DNA invertase Pin-like site-specific DNA recombinase